MTYYEELGVGAKASAEEIRKSYKRLARLLHPDRLSDKAAKHVAECQMRRLNGVYEILTDGEKRRKYDRSLAPPPPPPPMESPAEERVEGRRARVRELMRGPNVVWVGASALAIVVLLYLVDSGRAHSPRAANVIATKSAPAMSTSTAHNRVQPVTTAQLQSQIDELLRQRAHSQARIGELESRLRETSTSTVSLPEPVRTLRSSETPPVVPAATVAMDPAPAALPKRGLTGSWIFARSSNSKAKREAYAAEYIEAVISEHEGQLRGRYRARYRVPDKAISPEVVFEFQGEPAGTAASLPWLGNGGAQGEVRLRLLTENTLEVAWVANQLGNWGLGSGTAVLLRRQDRQ